MHVLRHYRDMSETQLVTIKDLLRFMLTIKSRAPMQINKATSAPHLPSRDPNAKSPPRASKPLRKEKSTAYRRFSTVVACMDSRWPTRRLEFTAEVIVDVLKENQAHGGMTRQDLRDAARLHIGDIGLLDHVLKAINNVIVGKNVVRRTVNPVTRIFEYSIREVGNEANVSEPQKEAPRKLLTASSLVSGVDVYNDLVYLYNNVLLDYRGSHPVELATQAIPLDSKHFAKEWPFVDAEDQYLLFICRLVPILCGTKA